MIKTSGRGVTGRGDRSPMTPDVAEVITDQWVVLSGADGVNISDCARLIK